MLNFKKVLQYFIISFLFTLVLSSCFKKYKDKIYIDGSSTVYPITEAVAEEFRKIEPDIRVTVGVSGTGGGFKKFIRGETDISNASRPISKKEIADCRKNKIDFIEIPVSFDGLAVVVSPNNDFVEYLTVNELKKIWEPAAQEKIKSWKQVRSTFPDVPLSLYGAGTASGTYDYFTEAIVGKAKSSRGDYTASEDDNILVQGVNRDKGALGYFGLAYFTENKDKLKLIPIDDEDDSNGKGPIYPSDSTVIAGFYQPLARPELIYVNVKSVKRESVRKFLDFYINNASALAKEVGYISLPPLAYELIKNRIDNNIEGSMFEFRSHVGLDLVEVLKEQNNK